MEKKWKKANVAGLKSKTGSRTRKPENFKTYARPTSTLSTYIKKNKETWSCLALPCLVYEKIGEVLHWSTPQFFHLCGGCTSDHWRRCANFLLGVQIWKNERLRLFFLHKQQLSLTVCGCSAKKVQSTNLFSPKNFLPWKISIWLRIMKLIEWTTTSA